jgi:hypothetical protein
MNRPHVFEGHLRGDLSFSCLGFVCPGVGTAIAVVSVVRAGLSLLTGDFDRLRGHYRCEGHGKLSPRASGDPNTLRCFEGRHAECTSEPGLRRRGGMQHLAVSSGVEVCKHVGEGNFSCVDDLSQSEQPRSTLRRSLR